MIKFEQTFTGTGGINGGSSHGEWIAPYISADKHGHQLLIEGDDCGYYISGFSFTAIPNFDNEENYQPISYLGEVIPREGKQYSVTVDKDAESTLLDFTVESGNNRVWLEDFIVTLSQKNPEGLPANWDNDVVVSQITSKDQFIAGKKFIIRAVNDTEGYGGDAYLVATTREVNGETIPVAEFRHGSEIGAEGSTITTADMLWEAHETTGISTTHAKGQALSSIVNLSNNGLYFQTRHGNQTHNTAAANGALYVTETVNGTNHTGNLVYATKLKESPTNAYFNFGIVEKTIDALAAYGQTFNVGINSNCNDNVTNLTTYLDVWNHDGHDGFNIEIGAGSGGSNYSATTCQYFVIYEVIPDDPKLAVTPEYSIFKQSYDEYLAADKDDFILGMCNNSPQYNAICEALVNAYEAEEFNRNAYNAAYKAWHDIASDKSLYRNLDVHRGSVIQITGQYGRKYSYNGTGMDWSSADGHSTFYYTPEGHLVDVASGLCVARRGSNNSYLDAVTSAGDHDDISGTNIPIITFTPAYLTGLTAYDSKFLFNFDRYDGNNASQDLGYVHNNDTQTNVSVGNGSAVNIARFISNVGSNINAWSYTVEYVTELPVKIHTDGKGTIVAPVALKAVNDDYFKTYIAGMNAEGQLVFTTTEGDESIPAGSHVVISTKDGHQATTVNIPVDYSGIAALTDDDAAAESRFVGSHLVKNITEKPGYVLYVKSETKESDNTDLTAKANDVVFEQAGTTIPAGALAFYAEDTRKEGQELPEVIALNLENPHNGTTGIVEVNAEGNAAVGAIYDLQGRRLNKAVKGLNIINGKKVLVK